MKLSPLALSLIAAISVSACQSVPNHSAPTVDDRPAKPIHRPSQHLITHTLDNGLTVIIKPDTRAPIVMTQIWYDVGSSDEPVGKGGMSHFLEHIMFKDAKGISSHDYQRLISHFGGDINA